jgi:hypothetical protein
MMLGVFACRAPCPVDDDFGPIQAANLVGEPAAGVVIEHSSRLLSIDLDDGGHLQTGLPAPPAGISLGETAGTPVSVFAWSRSGDADNRLTASVRTLDDGVFFQAFLDELAFSMEPAEGASCTINEASAVPGEYLIDDGDSSIALSAGQSKVVEQDGVSLLAQVIAAAIAESAPRGSGQAVLRRIEE